MNKDSSLEEQLKSFGIQLVFESFCHEYCFADIKNETHILLSNSPYELLYDP